MSKTSGARGGAAELATPSRGVAELATPSGGVATAASAGSLASMASTKASKNSENVKESSSSSPPSASPEVSGWLFKWTNYIKGYQKRWFVLNNGLLSYYRTQGEMAYASRGTISLHGASIQIEDSNNFIISNGGGTQTFHLRANTEVERQKWVTALELAKAKGLQTMMASEEDDLESDGENPNEITKQDLVSTVKLLSAKLEDLTTCSNLIGKHGSALIGSLNTLNVDRVMQADNQNDRAAVKDMVKTVTERAALLKLTSAAMVKASADFVLVCKNNGRRWQRIMENEREIRQRFEDMVEQYAQQHTNLENMIRKEMHLTDPAEQQDSSNADGAIKATRATSPMTEGTAKGGPVESGDISGSQLARSILSNSGSDDDDDFHDACDDEDEVFTISAPPCYDAFHSVLGAGSGSKSKSESSSKEDEGSDDEDMPTSSGNLIKIVKKKEDSVAREERVMDRQEENPVKKISLRQRRSRIPDRPNISISLWGIMKNSIGKDLTKIPVPVNFSEPLSMLQRLTEDFEYSDILDKAATCSDDCEQMAFVAAFTVSSYSTTAIRSSKPFNPLLGETYECDRSDDMGFRCVSEQVSHHPPMVAQYCESSSGLWQCWQEFSMRSKFKGKYLEVEPLGIAHLLFKESGNHYTWRKVKTVVHNIVIGKLWIDQHGEMKVINHAKDIACHMKFEPYSYFGGTPKKVTGSVVNANEKVEWVLNGTWDTKLEGSKVLSEEVVKGKSTMQVGPTELLWRAKPIPPGAEKYYFFTKFACELNELEDGVAPTDSRLRPDQRLMEEAEWDMANDEKVRLEEKQRAARRQREEAANQATQEGRTYEGYQPAWFKREPDHQNGGKYIFTYQGDYWKAKEKQDWEKCPDIY